jgi:hypothetical protein
MHVQERNGEDQPPRKRGEPAPGMFPAADRPSADDVVGLVDRLQERIQM